MRRCLQSAHALQRPGVQVLMQAPPATPQRLRTARGSGLESASRAPAGRSSYAAVEPAISIEGHRHEHGVRLQAAGQPEPGRDERQAGVPDASSRRSRTRSTRPATSTKSCSSSSQDICSLFDADRLTVYVALRGQARRSSRRSRPGLTSFKDLKLPINDQSIAGFVALTKKLVNIRDVYDENELRNLSPQLKFLKEVDKRTGLPHQADAGGTGAGSRHQRADRCRPGDQHHSGQPFPALGEEGIVNLCETLAIALKRRQKAPQASCAASTTRW